MKTNMPTQAKSEAKKSPNRYAEGFIMGQRKLCEALLEMEFKDIADYQWLLSHIKEVAKGREVLDNTAIGFRTITNLD